MASRHDDETRTMRHFLTTILLSLALLCWSGSAMAIKAEKSGQTSDKTETTEQAKPSEQGAKPQATEQAPTKSDKPAPARESHGGLLDRLKRQVQKAKSAPAPKYDQFQDDNKDGVSDKARKSWTGESVKSKPSRKVEQAPPEQERPKKTVEPQTPKKTKKTTPRPSTTKTKEKDP
jgi:hypothetical protein